VQEELDLVQRARQGEQEAFAQLYESHFDKIFRYVVLKIRNQAEAEDMAQQVFIKAYESIGSYQSQVCHLLPGSFALRITRWWIT